MAHPILYPSGLHVLPSIDLFVNFKQVDIILRPLESYFRKGSCDWNLPHQLVSVYTDSVCILRSSETSRRGAILGPYWLSSRNLSNNMYNYKAQHISGFHVECS